ncbi:MAG: hypothetical protein CMH56_16630 [Myxococcales bacterium]|nr:hypothetical protein [Myxococcales bacterium]
MAVLLNKKTFIFSMLLCTLACGTPLELHSVNPGQTAALTATQLQITGNGFNDQLQLALEASGLKISLGNIVVESPSQATASIPASAPADTYDLVATLNNASAILPEAVQLLGGTLRLIFLDVEQGDATLIIAPTGETLLIDGGPNFLDRTLTQAIAAHTDREPDAVVLTHHDADHLGGLVHYLMGDDGTAGTGDDRVPPTTYGPDDDGSCTSQTCSRFRHLLAYPFERAYAGTTFQLGEIEIDIVSSDGDLGDGPFANEIDENEKSVGLLIRYGNRKILIAGDLTGGGLDTTDLESPLSAKTGVLDVLRVSHHGSLTSTPQTALENWNPGLAVLSAGTHNAYCHPHPDVVERLLNHVESIWITGGGPDPETCGHTLTNHEKMNHSQGDITISVSADGTIDVTSQNQAND